ncbi:hypothetical protein ACFQ1S_18840 [Kibdelosporangium lantanae]|uniref:Carboxypeptidase regulatory-like domain-containing protein n=1 Tax=Kibdelosporangium lantanae TaxID=1497396 RepID=A0ABW3MCP7_9PSEU
MTSPDAPMDTVDAEVLTGLRDLWSTVDPMPTGLLDQIKFAVDLEHIEMEVARQVPLQPAMARGDDEQSRLITFDSDSLTIMVSLRTNHDGTIRLDGWLTPAGRHPVELRTDNQDQATVSDEDGRFVLDLVTPGMAQLVVRPDGTTRTVTTPTISL